MKNFLNVLLACLISTGFLFSQETVISGKLLGHDGKPMQKADVGLYRMSDPSKVLVSAEVHADGTFRLSTPERGLLRLQFAGVDHMAANVPVLAEKATAIGLDVRLAAHAYREKIDAPKIIGDFNNFSFASPKEMTRQSDGTFSAEFETDKKEFRYQIVNVLEQERSINGNQSDRFEYDGDGDYRSVVTPRNGKVKITFDPRNVRRSGVKQHVAFTSGDNTADRFFAAYQEVMDAQQAYQKAAADHQKSGKEMKTFSHDASSTLNSLKKRIADERDPFNRQLLLMEYLGIAPLSRRGVDSMIIRQALTEIPAESGLWSVSPGLLLSNTSRAGTTFDAETYFSNFLAKNGDKYLKSTIVFSKMMNAKFGGKEEEYKKYYTLLVTEYGDTQQGAMAKERFSLESAIAVGKTVPAFKLASLDNETMSISNELLKGKFTLLDFWAVWCGPCIGEMDNMHKAYERFKGKKFQIISFSFDAKPQDVIQFRKKKWNMPWLHAFVEKGFESDLAKRFEVMGIPKPILVDEAGKILAVDTELRGENLEKTLERFLGE